MDLKFSLNIEKEVEKMAFIDDYRTFKETNSDKKRSSQYEQGELFFKAMSEGINRQDIVNALMEIDGLKKSSAEKRVSACVTKYRDLNQSDNTSKATQNVANAASAVMDIPLDKLVSAPRKWNFFGQPNKVQYEDMVSSIYTYGLFHPITVWEQDNDKYMILGGHTRLSAFKDLYKVTSDKRFSTIPCNVYPKDKLDETDAKRIIILDNIAQRGNIITKDLARSYGELARLEKARGYYGSGDINARVGRLIGVSRKTVISYRSLNNLNDNLIDAFTNKTISLSEAVALSKLDSDLQQHIYEKEYYKRLKEIKLTALKHVFTISQLDDIFSESNAENDEDVITTIMLNIKSKEADTLRRILEEAIKTNFELTIETKNSLLDSLR